MMVIEVVVLFRPTPVADEAVVVVAAVVVVVDDDVLANSDANASVLMNTTECAGSIQRSNQSW